MLTIKDSSGKEIMTLKDDGEILVKDVKIEEEMTETARRLKAEEEDEKAKEKTEKE